MAITRREIEGFGMSATELLAKAVGGTGVAELVADIMPRKGVTFKLDHELLTIIDSYAARAKTSRTAIVEIMLWSAVKEIEKISEQQLEMKEIYEAETGKKYGGGKKFKELKPVEQAVKK
jgi:hypothetical protein